MQMRKIFHTMFQVYTEEKCGQLRIQVLVRQARITKTPRIPTPGSEAHDFSGQAPESLLQKQSEDG